jgi:hypothetical protein
MPVLRYCLHSLIFGSNAHVNTLFFLVYLSLQDRLLVLRKHIPNCGLRNHGGWYRSALNHREVKRVLCPFTLGLGETGGKFRQNSGFENVLGRMCGGVRKRGCGQLRQSPRSDP